MPSSKASVIIYGKINQEIYERLRKIGERLKKEYHAERVILFGSYATGEATGNSDVDFFTIALIVGNNTAEYVIKISAIRKGNENCIYKI